MLRFKWEAELKETEFGEIPEEWEEKPLKEVVAIPIKDGGTPSRKKNDIYFGGYIPWVTIKDIKRLIYDTNEHITEEGLKNSSAKLWPKDTIIFSFGATIAEVGIANAELATKQSICGIYIHEDKGVNFYYYYLLKFLKEYFKDLAGGTTFGEIRPTTFEKIPFPCPNPSEQSYIASVLSWFDELIENKERQIEIYEAAAEAIFKNSFFNLDALKKGEYDPSSIEDLPDGWEVKPIGEIAKCVSGFSYSSKEKFDEKVDDSFVFINLNNLIEGGGFKSEYSWLISEKLRERHYLEENDLIISNVHFGVGGSETERLMAVPALVNFPPGYDKKLGVYSMDLTRIISNSSKMKYYLYEYLKITREDSASFSTGTSILHLDHKNFKKNKMIICPDDLALEQFNSQVGPMFEKIKLNQKKIIVLKNIRDTLLPLLVFGRLRVEEI